jgi:RHS repeat-associated protein
MVRGICNAGRSHLCHLYDGQDAVRESGGTGAVAYLRALAIDEALTRTDPTSSRFYLGDALGSTVALTDATGATPTSFTYAPFGDTAVTGAPTASPFQFTGRENDGTGLYYYRARYYDPIRSRFISEDPAGMQGGTNLFAYVSGNPLALIDPTGLQPIGPPPVMGDVASYDS